MHASVGRVAREAVAVVFVALGAAAFAVFFRTAINAVFVHLYRARDVLAAFRTISWPWRLVIPAAGGALAGAMSVVASRFKGGQGVGDVMEAVVLGRRHISLRLALSKALGSWFAIVSGGSVGREGPIIQFGGGLGGAVGPLFDLGEGETRALVAAGTAAGFAAAYNTPLAAVLFVVEIVTGVIALDVVLPAMVATSIATAATRLAAGAGPIYGQRAFTVQWNLELVAHALLGVLAGLTGPAFMALLDRGEAAFAKLRLPKPLRAAVGASWVGALAIFLPEVTGNGYEAINLVLGEQVTIALALLLIFAKAAATTASVSSGSPGGVFTPSLFIGAALGSTFGQALTVVAPHAVGAPGGYALVGMAALIAATTHAPVLGAVMVFELSGDYAIVLPLLVATATATLVSRRLRPSSIYMEELARRGRGWEITIEGRRMRQKAPQSGSPEG
ncbi:MAG TPA: chloride channel protein [Polyangiaceae bacterium]|nr:chloride channel protein [Polyangiaceae bacterium]